MSDVLEMEPTESAILDHISKQAEANAHSREYGLLSPEDVDRLCAQEHRSEAFVEGFISHNSVSVLIGDSGLGKSPLAYQLGLCVAEGKPFLGMKTECGLVVYADYENGLMGSRELRDALVGFLGLQKPPDTFKLWTPDWASRSLQMEEICRDERPALFILDSLRSHNPSFEKTEWAGEGMAEFRSLASQYRVAIVVVHHTRKPGPDGVPDLDGDTTALMHWLNQAAGHRSIINQSDSRIAADHPSARRGGEIVLRWHRRIYGEGGPLYVQRVCNDDGEPIGYQRVSGPALLANAEQEAAFGQLPQEFAFKRAKQVYQRSDDPTRKWLQKCMAVGIVEQLGRGVYRKLRAGAADNNKPIE
jgi:hypothetical protein